MEVHSNENWSCPAYWLRFATNRSTVTFRFANGSGDYIAYIDKVYYVCDDIPCSIIYLNLFLYTSLFGIDFFVDPSYSFCVLFSQVD